MELPAAGGARPEACREPSPSLPDYVDQRAETGRQGGFAAPCFVAFLFNCEMGFLCFGIPGQAASSGVHSEIF